MNLLLDTHVALWAITDDPRLSAEARIRILDPKIRVFYSVASMWETAIKHSLKPDRIPVSGAEFLHFCEKAGYEGLPLRDRHVLALESLPHLHSDPFDRILVAQARAEALLLLTRDSVLAEYGENILLI